MKISNWLKSIPAVLLAAGIWINPAHAGNIYVGDPGFEQTDVNASTYTDYAYTQSGHVTDWEDINSLPGGGWGMWWMNTNYATVISPKRPDPRTGNQLLHGSGDYAWQTLDATFETGKTYTLSSYLAGDTDAGEDASDAADRSWLYIYHADTTPDLDTVFFDGDSLYGVSFNRDGSSSTSAGTGTATNAGWTIGGGKEWGLATISYTATPADDGRPIGIGIYGSADSAFDDIGFSVVPEPATTILCGIGMAGLAACRRRKSE